MPVIGGLRGPLRPWEFHDSNQQIQAVIWGITRDSTGAPLGNCDVHLYRTSDDREIDQTASNSSGYYEFRSPIPVETYYLVAYRSGSPDVAGTTVNTLVGGTQGGGVAPVALTYAQTILADTPVAYWRLGEASGNPQDSAGTNHVTAVGGTPTYGVTGAIIGDANTGVSFDGTTEYFSVPDNATLDVGDVFTLEAWVIPGATGASRGVISKGDGTGYLRIMNTGDLTLSVVNTGIIVTSTIVVPATGWHHLVATKSGATVKLYIDSVDVTGSVSNITCSNTAAALNIGAKDGGTAEFFNGSIDEPAVYNYALTQAQVQNHYHAAGY